MQLGQREKELDTTNGAAGRDEAKVDGPDRTVVEDGLREQAVRRLKRRREFRRHVEIYVAVNLALWVLWATPPDAANTDWFFPVWVMVIWGVFLALHAWHVYAGDRDEIPEHKIVEEMERLRSRRRS